MDDETREEFKKIHQRFDEFGQHLNEIQAENNEWHLKTYRLQQGLEARVNSLEDRVAALEKGY